MESDSITLKFDHKVIAATNSPSAYVTTNNFASGHKKISSALLMRS